MSASFTLLDSNTREHLAVVRHSSGAVTHIAWQELRPFCIFANPPGSAEHAAAAAQDSADDEDYRENDYSALAIVDDHLVICMTEAQGQGGIVAIRDLRNSQWVYIAMAEYIQAALPLFDQGLLVMLLSINVPYVGSPLSENHVWVSLLDGILDSQSDRSVPLPVLTTTSARHEHVTQPSVVFKRSLPEATTYGLFFDPTTQMVHAIDGPEFSAQYSIAEIQQALSMRPQ